MLLPFLILLPFSAAILLAVLRFSDKSFVRWVSLFASLATLLLSLVLVDQYRSLPAGGRHAGPVKPALEWRHTWLTYDIPVEGSAEGRTMSCEFYLGVDGISVLLIVLTALLTVSCILASWNSVDERVMEFHACLLILE
ncbi:MAG: NADH-quinone oxidoreductase subunit M, partial [Planctomycetaceae bacterium]